MAQRKVPLINGYYYHVYNRTGHGLSPFSDKRSAIEFVKAINYYAQENPPTKLSLIDKVHKDVKEDYNHRLVDVLAYCVMPNHFHLLLKQIQDRGISRYLQRIQVSISHYYNLQNKERGSLFQGRFKAVLIESEDHLLHVSRYIHLNPSSAKLVKDPLEYPYSSLTLYAHNTFPLPLVAGGILRSRETAESYLKFVRDNILYQAELQRIKHELIDEEL